MIRARSYTPQALQNIHAKNLANTNIPMRSKMDIIRKKYQFIIDTLLIAMVSMLALLISIYFWFSKDKEL